MIINSCAVSAMGDDELGKELEKELNDHHLNYQIDKWGYPGSFRPIYLCL